MPKNYRLAQNDPLLDELMNTSVDSDLPPLPGESGEDMGLESDVRMKQQLPGTQSGPLTDEEIHKKLLAALLYASLNGVATVEETENDPGKLTIRFPEGEEWHITFDGDRAMLSGFDNIALEQFIGSMSEENDKYDLIRMAENATKLINESRESPEEAPPVSFKGQAEIGDEPDLELDSPELAPAPMVEDPMDMPLADPMNFDPMAEPLPPVDPMVPAPPMGAPAPAQPPLGTPPMGGPAPQPMAPAPAQPPMNPPMF
jgi:hypothetical protein